MTNPIDVKHISLYTNNASNVRKRKHHETDLQKKVTDLISKDETLLSTTSPNIPSFSQDDTILALSKPGKTSEIKKRPSSLPPKCLSQLISKTPTINDLLDQAIEDYSNDLLRETANKEDSEKSYNKLILALEKKYNLTKNIYFLDRLIELYKIIINEFNNKPEILSDIYYRLGKAYETLNKPNYFNLAIQSYIQGLNLCQEQDKRPLAFVLYMCLRRSLSRGENPESIFEQFNSTNLSNYITKNEYSTFFLDLGMECIKRNNNKDSQEKALEYFHKGIQAEPQSTTLRNHLHYRRGEVYIQRNGPNDLELAIKELKLAIKAQPSDQSALAETYNLLGQTLLKSNFTKDHDEAIYAFQIALTFELGCNDLLRAKICANLCLILEKMTSIDLDSKIKLLECSTAFNFESKTLKVKLNQLLAKYLLRRNGKEDIKRCISICRGIIPFANTSFLQKRLCLTLGEALVHRNSIGDINEALNLFVKGLNIYDTDLALHAEIFLTYAKTFAERNQDGDLKNAIKYYSKGLIVRHHDNQITASLHYHLGLSYEQMNDYENAIKNYQSSLNYFDQENSLLKVQACLKLSLLLQQQNDNNNNNNTIISCCRHALIYRFNLSDINEAIIKIQIILLLARTYEKTEKDSKAIIYYKIGIELTSFYDNNQMREWKAIFLHNVGFLQEKQKKSSELDKAIENYKDALNLNIKSPVIANIHFNIARALSNRRKNNDLKSAQDHLHSALILAEEDHLTSKDINQLLDIVNNELKRS